MPDPEEIGTPAWEAAVLRRQADHAEQAGDNESAEALRQRADEKIRTQETAATVTTADLTMLALGQHFQAPPGTEAEQIAVTNDGYVPPFQVQRGHDPFGRAQRDVLADARSYLETAPDTRASALIDGLAVEVDQLRRQVPSGDTAGVFALLRDIADAEPLAYENGQRCSMCGAHTYGEGSGLPFPHLISCPWARAVQVVGVRDDG